MCNEGSYWTSSNSDDRTCVPCAESSAGTWINNAVGPAVCFQRNLLANQLVDTLCMYTLVCISAAALLVCSIEAWKRVRPHAVAPEVLLVRTASDQHHWTVRVLVIYAVSRFCFDVTLSAMGRNVPMALYLPNLDPQGKGTEQNSLFATACTCAAVAGAVLCYTVARTRPTSSFQHADRARRVYVILMIYTLTMLFVHGTCELRQINGSVRVVSEGGDSAQGVPTQLAPVYLHRKLWITSFAVSASVVILLIALMCRDCCDDITRHLEEDRRVPPLVNTLFLQRNAAPTREPHVESQAEVFRAGACVICMDSQPNVMFCACRHLVTCEPCFQNLVSYNLPCPVCKKLVSSYSVVPIAPPDSPPSATRTGITADAAIPTTDSIV